MQLRKLFIISALSLTLIPATGSAQSWFFSPYIGANFGGNASLVSSTTSTMSSSDESTSAQRSDGIPASSGSRSTSAGLRTFSKTRRATRTSNLAAATSPR
jgi:hypothetical protein